MAAKVSIIISVFNGAQFLEEAILSALHQDAYDPEVIVVDDGSTDGSLEVAHRFKGTTVLTQPNSGVAVTRNRGAKVATGEFLLFLDCDDWIEPNYLRVTVPLMQDPKVGVVATGMQRFGLRNDVALPTGTTLSHELYSNDLPVTSLIRRTAFLGYRTTWDPGGSNGTEDPACGTETQNVGIVGYEDWDLWIRILADGWQVATTDQTLFHYRVGAGTMISKSHGIEGRLIRMLREMNRDIFASQRV